MRDEMYGQMEEILRASGAEILPYEKRNPYRWQRNATRLVAHGWEAIPKRSVLDAWKSMSTTFKSSVVDASSFVSHPEKS